MTQGTSRPVEDKKLVSIGIAVYQNAGSLPGLTDEIFAAFAALPDLRLEIVFVND